MRLERLDQAALLLGLKIMLDGRGACEGMGSPQTVSCLELFKIKNRAKRFYLRTKRRKLSKLHLKFVIQKRH